MSRPHLVDSEGKPLCPEAAELDALDDGAFWERVLNGRTDGPDTEDPDDVPTTRQFDPCPLCGERGACGYDDQGRPLIHDLDEIGD